MSWSPEAWSARSAMWPDERVARLRHLAAEGLSAAVIGQHLGCAKGSIIGKCRRMGIPLLGPNFMALRGLKPVAVIVRPIAVRSDTLPPLASGEAARKAPERAKVPEPPKPPSRSKATCQWPLNDRRPWKFCGAACALGEVYCRSHAKVAYVRRCERQEDAA